MKFADLKPGDKLRYTRDSPMRWLPSVSDPPFELRKGDIIEFVCWSPILEGAIRFKCANATTPNGLLGIGVHWLEKVEKGGPCRCPRENFSWNGIGCQCGGT